MGVVSVILVVRFFSLPEDTGDNVSRESVFTGSGIKEYLSG